MIQALGNADEGQVSYQTSEVDPMWCCTPVTLWVIFQLAAGTFLLGLAS